MPDDSQKPFYLNWIAALGVSAASVSAWALKSATKPVQKRISIIDLLDAANLPDRVGKIESHMEKFDQVAVDVQVIKSQTENTKETVDHIHRMIEAMVTSK